MGDLLIFNDRFSDNVGDGVIAECLEYGVRTLSPAVTVRTLDLGGRQGYLSSGAKPADWLRRLWHCAPGVARRALSRHRVQQLFRAQVAEAMQTARAVVVGGGQLITGSSTFFAERLAVVADEAHRRGVPVYIHAVGVSDPAAWCDEARAMLSAAFSRAGGTVGVTVRDEASARYWARAFGGTQPALARDPGLLAGQAYAGLVAGARTANTEAKAGQLVPGRGSAGAKQRIGVGVIAPAVVDHLASAGERTVPASAEYFAEIAVALAQAGFQPVLFCNGSSEDAPLLAAAARIAANRSELPAGMITVAERPRSARALIGCIADFDAVIAHRLHANIVAHALQIPHLGLGWDDKIAAYFTSIDRDDWLVTSADCAPAALVQKLKAALRTGIDDHRYRMVTGEAWAGIARLIGQIEPHVLPRRAI